MRAIHWRMAVLRPSPFGAFLIQLCAALASGVCASLLPAATLPALVKYTFTFFPVVLTANLGILVHL